MERGARSGIQSDEGRRDSLNGPLIGDVIWSERNLLLPSGDRCDWFVVLEVDWDRPERQASLGRAWLGGARWGSVWQGEVGSGAKTLDIDAPQADLFADEERESEFQETLRFS